MRKTVLLHGALAVVLLASCSSRHYQLTSVERTRIIVDSRYDQHPDESAAKFMAPYKRVNDSLMGPSWGRWLTTCTPSDQRATSRISSPISSCGQQRTITSNQCWESITWAASAPTLPKGMSPTRMCSMWLPLRIRYVSTVDATLLTDSRQGAGRASARGLNS